MLNIEEIVVGTQEYRANRKEIHDHDIHHVLCADLVEHIYRAHIQPPYELSHDDLFDESDEDSDMFVESEDSDDESDVQENKELKTMRSMTMTTIPSDVFWFFSN